MTLGRINNEGNMDPLTPNLVLYDHPLSSYAQKVRLALRLKGIPFSSVVPTNLGSGQPIPSLSAANPRLEVPVLEVSPPNSPSSNNEGGGSKEEETFSIFDSKTILAYIEEAFPANKPNLLPLVQDARGRAKARMLEDICDGPYEAVNWALAEITHCDRAGPEGSALRAEMLKHAEESTREIHGWLAGKLREGRTKFFHGDEFGYADLVVIPFMNRSVHFYGSLLMPASAQEEEGENRQDAASLLSDWRERCLHIPEVRRTYEEMVEAAGATTKAFKSGAFAVGSGRRREYRDYRLEFMIKAGGLDVVARGIRDETIRFGWPM